MSYLQTELISHGRKVRALYKEALRHLQGACHLKRDGRLLFRFQAVLLRARFDENKDLKDYSVAKKMVEDGHKELIAKLGGCPPIKFPSSPGGSAFGREVYVPDALLDSWHPREKALYPDYFARRDIRKREYIERWQEKYGKAATES